MKWTKIIIFMLVVVISGMASLLFAQNEPKTKTQQTDLGSGDEDRKKKILQQKKKDQASSEIDKKGEGKSVPMTIPNYKPPLRGAPVGRVAGGTRGILCENECLLCVLTPDHTALTVQAQPSLYYFIGGKTKHTIELTVIEEQGIHPILEKQIVSSEIPGIKAIHLRDYDFHLDKDKVYKWFVTIIPDPVRRSKDVLAWGAVKRIDIPESVRQKIARSEKAVVPQIYAEAGIWYDSFAEISSLIESHPNNREFRQQRAALLEQVGLKEIGQLDLK